jgi:hypothetical protein
MSEARENPFDLKGKPMTEAQRKILQDALPIFREHLSILSKSLNRITTNLTELKLDVNV